ncbi:hypothetical protein ABEG10_38170 (plasmid) [Burkholderia cenocepacia]|uniref:hypothetical protein n=2 Tax=Burkholderia cenocepacia TaxID=95486 RepID=UPI00209ECE46|nr:hypothetical protein [Burkholderia cenocepacia]MCO8402786.1 hypothetical protein [Burkholderia cenocepacia]MCO8423079.1 hypothetical protein [Burkholderia cenocepacia]MCO8474772.1 hypothetical protein [Burkholderia cenocepacia]MCO8482048.1 hypothetical protein [Burkholderia cenocepacia]MCO8488715.1 hypothetical protein [Burkholderia cenocepacia]
MNRHLATMLADVGERDWQSFVRAHGWRVPAPLLAHLLGQPRDAVQRYRDLGVCARRPAPLPYVELFSLWHGRAPEDADWPPPWKASAHATYVWLPPEHAMLAELVGQISVDQIADVLTERLRTLTGDATAIRSKPAVQVQINRLGLQSDDVLGGLTAAQAGREIGSLQSVYQAIWTGKLPIQKVGRLRVIPHAAWTEWKAAHVAPAAGFVRLSSIRDALGIRSDKLSEFARMGYVPTAVPCNPTGAGPSTQYGTWWIDPVVAAQLVADRRAGKPMPWHGKPMLDNLRGSFKLWTQRRHPVTCATCAQIWGEAGAPASFDEYILRYPSLARGAKRHLTRVWAPGLTIDEVARAARCSTTKVREAIANGAITVTSSSGEDRVTQTDATRWIARHTPDGTGARSWISLDAATRQYGFPKAQLRAMITRGVLKHKVGTDGPMRGVHYVPRQQCRDLRDAIGFTREEAARFVDVTVAELDSLLAGVHWRQNGLIPFVTVQQVIKRRDSRCGYTLEQAAALLGVSLAWVESRRDDGTIRLVTASWAPDRPYLTDPMLRRLRLALERIDIAVEPAEEAARQWPTVGPAALMAGVCITTLGAWGTVGDVTRREINGIWRYEPESLRARARLYWATVRFHRAQPPAWLAAEHTTDARDAGDRSHRVPVELDSGNGAST